MSFVCSSQRSGEERCLRGVIILPTGKDDQLRVPGGAFRPVKIRLSFEAVPGIRYRRVLMMLRHLMSA